MSDASANPIRADSKRDARDVLRGFAYQIDLTILRWIKLGWSDLLRVEYGEDIAVLAGAVSANTNDQDLILEQVKLRGRNLTLNSDECLRSLAYFAGTQADNPDRSIRFIYTTNASIGAESTPVTNLGIKCLEVWNSQDALNQGELTSFTESVGKSIRQSKKPAKLSDRDWNSLQSVAKPEALDQLRHIIASIRWETGAGSPEQVKQDIQNELTGRGICSSIHEVEAAHNKLLTFILRQIASKDRLPLSRQNLNEVLNSGYSPDPAILSILSKLSGALSQIESKSDTILDQLQNVATKSQFEELVTQTRQLSARMSALVTIDDDPTAEASGYKKIVREEVMRCLDNQHPDEALNKIDEWLLLQSDNQVELAYLHNLKGTVLRWMDQTELAAQAFHLAYETHGNLRYKASEALCLIEGGEPQTAEAVVNEVLSEKVFDYALIIKSQALKAQYRDEEALDVFQSSKVEVTKLNESDWFVRKAEALLNAGRAAEGFATFEMISQKDDSPAIKIDYAGFLNFHCQQFNDPSLAERSLELMRSLPDIISPTRSISARDAAKLTAYRHVHCAAALYLLGRASEGVRYAESNLHEDVDNEIAIQLMPLYGKAGETARYNEILDRFSEDEAMQDMRVAYAYILRRAERGISEEELERLIARFPEDRRQREVALLLLRAAWNSFNDNHERTVEILLSIANRADFDTNDRITNLFRAQLKLLADKQYTRLLQVSEPLMEIIANDSLAGVSMAVKRGISGGSMDNEAIRPWVDRIHRRLLEKPLVVGRDLALATYRSWAFSALRLKDRSDVIESLIALIPDHGYTNEELDQTITDVLLKREMYWVDLVILMR